MKIVFTGITGFVGGHLMRHFSKLGNEVMGLGRGAHPPTEVHKYGLYQHILLLHLPIDGWINRRGTDRFK